MSRHERQQTRFRTPAAEAKRGEMVAKIAELLILFGVAQIPLRDIALKLGTSDRMLLYYFDNKSDLVQACIEEVSEELGRQLITETRPLSHPAAVLRAVFALFQRSDIIPYLKVWADVSARSERGEEPYRTIAAESLIGSAAWLEAQLDIRDKATRETMAASILTIVEGARLLAATSPAMANQAVEYLAGRLEIERSISAL